MYRGALAVAFIKLLLGFNQHHDLYRSFEDHTQ